MSATCDRMMCGRPIVHRIAGRGYCLVHAEAFARAINERIGRVVLRIPVSA
jgi:hypothetical protein